MKIEKREKITPGHAEDCFTEAMEFELFCIITICSLTQKQAKDTLKRESMRKSTGSM